MRLLEIFFEVYMFIVEGTDMKVCQYLRFHMEIICWRFHIKTHFTVWDMRTCDMWKFCLKTFRNNRICKKLAYFLRNLQTLRVNNSRILRFKNVKFSGYSFYMRTNIWWNFQICISVSLKRLPFFLFLQN